MELVKTRIADDLTFGRQAPRPANVMKRLSAVYDEARVFEQEMSKTRMPLDPLLREGERRLQRLLGDENNNASDAWQQFYRAFFWFLGQSFFQAEADLAHLTSIKKTEERFKKKIGSHFGARLQRAFTLALLGVSPDDRQWIRNQFQRDDALDFQWGTAIAGAAAVARAASCLNSMGEHVALADLELDLHYKIDLIVELNEEPLRLVCAQVKYLKKGFSTAEILELEGETDQRSYTPEQERMLDGLILFRKRFLVDWIPMLIRVGKEDLPIRFLEPLPLLQHTLQTALGRLKS